MSSDSGSVSSIADILETEPMYYVLAQFLETRDSANPKNVATALTDICTELKGIRSALETIATARTKTE